jgi:hypothetical protein
MTRRGTTKTRSVYTHNFADDDDDVSLKSDGDNNYGIDYPVQSLQANAHDRKFKPNAGRNNQQTQRVTMHRDRWFALSKDAHSIWDQLSDADKAIILGKDTDNGDTKTPTRKINLHETSVYDFIRANMHEVDTKGTVDNDVVKATESDGTADMDDEPQSETRLIHAAKSGNITEKKLSPGDIRRVMSKASTRTVKMADISYTVSINQQKATTHSLVDRGANGGVAGNDVRIIFKTNRTVDIRGIDNHQVTDIDIGTVGGVVQSQKGPIIAVMHQYALLNKGHSIHSPCQFESYKVTVDDKSVRAGGTQRIQTPDGYTIPLSIKDGLARLDIRPYTDQEWDSLPHVFLTDEANWDPSVLDHQYNSFEEWYGNRLWQDAVALELKQINEYGAFTDVGYPDKTQPPDYYKKTRMHFRVVAKHDGRHKARLVTDGHLTDVPQDSVYSGVVSLRGSRTVLFLAELSGLYTWATDILSNFWWNSQVWTQLKAMLFWHGGTDGIDG